MIRIARIVFNQNKIRSNTVIRALSAQAAVSYKPKEDEFANAIPYDQIPGLSKFEYIRRYLPGGKYHNAKFGDIQKSMRDEFGDFYRLPGVFGQNSVIVALHADDIEFILRNAGTYPYRRGLETMAHFRKNIRSDVYEVGGLIIEQGEDWHKMRMIANPILMQPKLVKSYIPTIDGIVNDFMENLPIIQDEKGEMPADFNDYLNRWSLESITAIALEKRLGLMDFRKPSENGLKISKAVRTIFTLGMEFELKPTIWRYYETKQFKELMKAYNDLTDLSAVFIDEAMKRFENDPNLASDQEMGMLFKLLQKDKRYATVMAFDMIFAGIDTTTSALSSSMFCLAKNPEKQERLREELMRVMPEKDTPLTGERMKNMPYLRGVIKEALRLYPPSPANMRRAMENLVIRGYQVPNGVDIILGMIQLHTNPQYFGSPEAFVPERWVRDQQEAACPVSLKQSHPFSYLPFGYGARFCAGKRVAEMELEVFLSRLFRNYKVEWHHPDLRLKTTMINILEGDFKFRMIKL